MRGPENAVFVYSFWASALARQQQTPVKAKIASKAPITVKAMLAQETCTQAKTITKMAKMNLQKHNFIVASFNNASIMVGYIIPNID